MFAGFLTPQLKSDLESLWEVTTVTAEEYARVRTGAICRPAAAPDEPGFLFRYPRLACFQVRRMFLPIQPPDAPTRHVVVTGDQLYEFDRCRTCGRTSPPLRRCPVCRLRYCGRACQKQDWRRHKSVCRYLMAWQHACFAQHGQHDRPTVLVYRPDDDCYDVGTVSPADVPRLRASRDKEEQYQEGDQALLQAALSRLHVSGGAGSASSSSGLTV